MKTRIAVLLIFLLTFFNLQSQTNGIGLISAEELENNFQKYIVIDVSKPEVFIENSINGSINISRKDVANNKAEYGGLMASKEEIEALLTRLQISPNDQIVLYDHKGGCDAARVWWVLSYYGHKSVQLLDGGLNSWGERVGIKSKLDNLNPKENYRFGSSSVSQVRYATFHDVKRALSDTNSILVDTRSQIEFEGGIQKDGSFRKGRIPGSIHIDWASNIDYHGGQHLLSRDDLLKLYESKGIAKHKNIIVYCHSGVRSSHTAFVLTEVLGYPRVSNFDGSWIEWSYYSELPIETGSMPVESTVNMLTYSEVFWKGFKDFGTYTWREITLKVSPWYVNYFWLLIVLSVIVWLLEIIFPWRKNQPIIRNDFWLDAFFMFFNFYIFKLVIFMSFSEVTAKFFHEIIGGEVSDFALFDMTGFPLWTQLLIFFVATDFVQWFTHVLLHRFDIFWRFHKVHHSVEQMGFAAHLRYHWMENVFYTPMKYMMVMLIGGFTPEMAYVVFYLAIAIGHLNHANIGWSYGPLKYIFNNPKMHIWHHAKNLPNSRKYGVNFGISLSLWDYIFRKNYIPSDGRDIELGFEGIEQYPKGFFNLIFSGFRKK